MKEETRTDKLINRLVFWSVVIFTMFGQIKYESDSVLFRYNGAILCISDQMEHKQEPRRFFELHVK